jgi:hypothetical protein
MKSTAYKKYKHEVWWERVFWKNQIDQEETIQDNVHSTVEEELFEMSGRHFVRRRQKIQISKR